MPRSQSRADRHWISRNHSLRRRWPVYLMLLLLGIACIALVVLVFDGIDNPERSQGQSAPVPAAIR